MEIQLNREDITTIKCALSEAIINNSKEYPMLSKLYDELYSKIEKQTKKNKS